MHSSPSNDLELTSSRHSAGLRPHGACVILIALTLLVPRPAAAERRAPVGTAPGSDVEGKRVIVVDSPCPGPDCPPDAVPQAQGLRVVYLAFDGVTLQRSDTTDNAITNFSAIVNSQTEVVPAFRVQDLSQTLGLSRAQIIQRVVDQLYELHEPYNVEFVLERPTSGNYSMIVFGGTCETVAGSSNCAGIALRDCGDFMPSNITFVFPDGLRVDDLAPTAAQEAAHAFGLGHTDDYTDVMYPQLQYNYIPSRFGKGNIPDGSGCPPSATYQDSHQQMMSIIGPRGQDTTRPTVEITSPANGAVITAGTVLRAEASDDDAVSSVAFVLGDQSIGSDDQAPYEITLPDGIAAGELILRARATDVSGNTGIDAITVYVSTGGDAPPGFGDDCSTGEACVSGICATVGDRSLCTQRCATDTECPDGYTCLDGTACWPTGGGAGAEGGSGGCRTGGGPGGALTALLLALLLARGRSCQTD